jgi:hypothetical protein
MFLTIAVTICFEFARVIEKDIRIRWFEIVAIVFVSVQSPINFVLPGDGVQVHKILG